MHMFRYTKGISTKIEMKSVTYPSLGRTAKRLKELEKADFYVFFFVFLWSLLHFVPIVIFYIK